MNSNHSGTDKPAPRESSGDTAGLPESPESAGAAGSGSSTQPAVSSSGTRQLRTGTIHMTGAEAEAHHRAPARWSVGDIILDLYEVKDIFDTGGTATVYRVRHRAWGRDLAVKTPKPGLLETSAGRENFVREAETWVNLGLHPHIVSCYYVRVLCGTPFVFSEFIDGGSLFDLIQSRALYRGGEAESLTRILDIAIQAAWGLQFAHQQGLIHQDVKPANIMTTGAGTAKVTDFGLAKASALIGALPRGYGDNIVATCGGMTPAYCSPEQAAIVAQAQQGMPQHKREKLTPATDIWSWGVSILEMFTGAVTWQSGEQAAEAFHALTPGRPLCAGLPPLPEKLFALIGRCLTHNPAERPFLDQAIGLLQDIYRTAAGSLYPRPDPQSAQALADSLNNRGVSLIDLDHIPEAAECFNRALALHPGHPDATYNRALMLWRSGSISDSAAIRSVEEMLHARPDDDKSEALLARLELERGNYESALERCEPLSPESPALQDARDVMDAARSRRNLTRRCVKTLEGHSNAVNALCLHPQEKVLFSGSGSPVAFAREKDFSIRMWDIETGSLISTYTGHGGKITSVCCDHTGTLLLSASVDGTLKLWDTVSRTCLRTLAGHEEPVECACMSDDGSRAASGGRSGAVFVWDVHTGRCISSIRAHEGAVAALCWTPDGSRIISAGRDAAIRIWDIRSGACTRTLTGHSGPVTTLSISSGAGRILSGSSDTTVRLWSLQDGCCLKAFAGHAEAVTAVCLSPTGQYFLSGGGSFFGKERALKLWETERGRCLYTFTGHAGAVTSACFAPDGLHAFSGSEDATIKQWCVSITSPALPAPMSLSQLSASEDALRAHSAYEHHVGKAHDAVSAHMPGEARNHLMRARAQKGYERSPEALSLWLQLYRKLPKQGLRGAWAEQVLQGHADAVTAVCMCSGGRAAASGSEQGELRLWDLNSFQCLAAIEAHSGPICALCPAGERLLSGAGDGSIKIWATADPSCAHTLKAHRQSVYALAAAPDSRMFASGSADALIKLWDVKTGACRATLSGHAGPVTSLGVTPDGRFIVSGSGDSTVRLWDTAAGTCVRIFEDRSSPVACLDVSSDGMRVITGHADCSIRIWEIETGSCLSAVQGHAGRITAVAMSCDRHCAASGSDDGTVRLWDPGTGSALRVFEGHEYGVSGIDLAPPGHRLISGGKDAAVRLWMLDWELASPGADTWDEGAAAYLRAFLTMRASGGTCSPQPERPRGEITAPPRDSSEFAALLDRLACAGYGWIPPSAVESHLKALAGHACHQGNTPDSSRPPESRDAPPAGRSGKDKKKRSTLRLDID